MDKRVLIRADNWRFRGHIAAYGSYPTRWQLRDVFARNDGEWGDDPLPSYGDGGYPIAYLEVVARDALTLSRNEWDTGDCTVCARCAESCKPDSESEWGYLPLLQVNAEITGYNDCRVVRCERCGEIIHDYETLTVWRYEHGEEPESHEYYASDYETALADAREYAALGMVAIVRDSERCLDEFVTGEKWPVETVAAFAPLRHMPLPSARQYPLFIR